MKKIEQEELERFIKDGAEMKEGYINEYYRIGKDAYMWVISYVGDIRFIDKDLSQMWIWIKYEDVLYAYHINLSMVEEPEKIIKDLDNSNDVFNRLEEVIKLKIYNYLHNKEWKKLKDESFTIVRSIEDIL
jgi:hypothetical protein